MDRRRTDAAPSFAHPSGVVDPDRDPCSERVRDRLEFGTTFQDTTDEIAPAQPLASLIDGNLPAFALSLGALAISSDLTPGEILSVAAAEIYRLRRVRDQFLPRSLRGEPAWDMLLALYAEANVTTTRSSLSHASGVPHSTAMRWIALLERDQLLEQLQHPRDEGLWLVALTHRGRNLIEAALKAMLHTADR